MSSLSKGLRLGIIVWAMIVSDAQKLNNTIEKILIPKLDQLDVVNEIYEPLSCRLAISRLFEVSQFS